MIVYVLLGAGGVALVVGVASLFRDRGHREATAWYALAYTLFMLAGVVAGNWWMAGFSLLVLLYLAWAWKHPPKGVTRR